MSRRFTEAEIAEVWERLPPIGWLWFSVSVMRGGSALMAAVGALDCCVSIVSPRIEVGGLSRTAGPFGARGGDSGDAGSWLPG